MFLGVVAKPNKDRGFDGKIHLERISKQFMVEKRTAYQRFSEDQILLLERFGIG